MNKATMQFLKNYFKEKKKVLQKNDTFFIFKGTIACLKKKA